MPSVITIAGEQLFAAKAQANEKLDIDTFIFANVPGQDPNAPINRSEGIPTAHIVHQQIVQQVGRINENVVVYSTVLDSLTGPFEFNWVGLYSSVNEKLVAINHVPTVTKTVTEPGTAGNTLNRNFGIEYSGIADLAGITVSPETWQLDFTARLTGMDELTRQLAADMNGKDWFIGDGFKVVPRSTVNTFKVTAGAGYVSGLRVELAADHILAVASYPKFVYVDAWFDGTSGSQWKGQKTFTVTNTEMDDYIDVTGKQHYVFKLATITAADAVIDHRENLGIAQKIETVSYLKSLKSVPRLNQTVEAFYSNDTGVGGQFIYYENMSGDEHNGGTVLAKAALAAWDGTAEDLNTLLLWEGSAAGCFVRVMNSGPEQSVVSPEMFGATVGGVEDCTASFNAIKAAGYRPYLSYGVTYNVNYTSANDMLGVEGKGIVTNGYITIYAEELDGSVTEFEDQQTAITPTGPIIRRQRTTHEDMDLFVDKSAVTSGNGSISSPFRTINEALAFVPREIYHKVRVYLADGVYDEMGDSFNLYNYFITPRSTEGFQIIGHVPENPLYSDTDLDAVVIGNASGANTVSNFVIGGLLGDADDVKTIGVTINGRVQVYGCHYCFDRVKFRKGRNGFLTGGHGGKVKFSSCDFDDAAEAVFDLTDLAHYFITNCTGGGNYGRVALVKNGSILMFEESDALATSAVIQQEGNCIVKINGDYISTGSSGANQGSQSWGLRGPNGERLTAMNALGTLYSAGTFVGGRVGSPAMPTSDSFAMYMDNNGNLWLRSVFNGVTKQAKVFDFDSGLIQ